MSDDLMNYDDPRRPVATVADLAALDSDEIVEGYRDAFGSEPCGGNRSRAYWHGWSNGMRDRGEQEQTAESVMLAAEYVSPAGRAALSKARGE